MKRSIYHIVLFMLVFIPVTLSVTDVMAQKQKPVTHLVVDQCQTLELSVVEVPGDRYTWEIYRDSTVNFAKTKGDLDPVIYFENSMYEGSTVRVNWLEPGRYFVEVMVWDETTCTNNLLVYKVDVIEYKPEAYAIGDSLCIGEPAVVKIIFTGRGPWDVTYTYGDGTNYVNLTGIVEDEYTIPTDQLPRLNESLEIWVMEVTDQCTVRSYPVPQKARIQIMPKPNNSKIYLRE